MKLVMVMDEKTVAKTARTTMEFRQFPFEGPPPAAMRDSGLMGR